MHIFYMSNHSRTFIKASVTDITFVLFGNLHRWNNACFKYHFMLLIHIFSTTMDFFDVIFQISHIIKCIFAFVARNIFSLDGCKNGFGNPSIGCFDSCDIIFSAAAVVLGGGNIRISWFNVIGAIIYFFREINYFLFYF